MLAKRIIPCLDCDLSFANGRVVKGIEFKQIRYAGIPWKLAKKYYEQGADEICFLDITASVEKRETMLNVIEKTCRNMFVPIIAGGGIRSVGDAKKALRSGADKISINTAAIKNPGLIDDLSKKFGSQAIVVAIDAKKMGDLWNCSIFGGRTLTETNAIEWAKEAAQRGAGEILLTSMDRDGTKSGFDIELTKRVSEAVNIPVIASGGAGDLESIAEVLIKGKADAALAASIFHYGKYSVGQVKDYLKNAGVTVR